MDQDQSVPHLASIKMYVVVLCTFVLSSRGFEKVLTQANQLRYLVANISCQVAVHGRPLDKNYLLPGILEFDFRSKVNF